MRRLGRSKSAVSGAQNGAHRPSGAARTAKKPTHGCQKALRNYGKLKFPGFLMTGKDWYMMADDKTKIVDRDKFFRCRNFQMNI